jgi:uncharacterized protein (TIGR02246 family)
MRDQAALRHLAELYARAVDRRDSELFLSLFTEDAVLESHASTWEGREQLAGIPVRLRTRYQMTLHTVLNQEVTIDGDRAEGETCSIAYHLFPPKDGKQERLDMTIRYQDRFVRRNGEWLFARRRLDVQWTQTMDHPVA